MLMVIGVEHLVKHHVRAEASGRHIDGIALRNSESLPEARIVRGNGELAAGKVYPAAALRELVGRVFQHGYVREAVVLVHLAAGVDIYALDGLAVLTAEHIPQLIAADHISEHDTQSRRHNDD